MRILAIETTGVSGSLALLDGETLIESRKLPDQQRSAESLIPSIQSLLARWNWSPKSLEGIAVAVGPGSFTGLRVGLTCAKVLAWGTGAKIFGVDTLEALAEKAAYSSNSTEIAPFFLSAGIDAQRREAAVRNFFVSGGNVFPLDFGFRLVPIAEWLSPNGEIFQKYFWKDGQKEIKNAIIKVSGTEGLMLDDLPVFFTGPILQRWGDRAEASVRRFLCAEQDWYPDAADIARLAVRKAEPADAWRILPVYSRLSAAEEKLAQKAVQNHLEKKY